MPHAMNNNSWNGTEMHSLFNHPNNKNNNNFKTNKTDEELMAHRNTPVSVLKKFIEDDQEVRNFDLEQKKTLATVFGYTSGVGNRILRITGEQILANVMRQLGTEYFKNIKCDSLNAEECYVKKLKSLCSNNTKINNILDLIKKRLDTNSTHFQEIKTNTSTKSMGGKKKKPVKKKPAKKKPVKKKPAKKKPTGKKKVRKIHRGPKGGKYYISKGRKVYI